MSTKSKTKNVKDTFKEFMGFYASLVSFLITNALILLPITMFYKEDLFRIVSMDVINVNLGLLILIYLIFIWFYIKSSSFKHISDKRVKTIVILSIFLLLPWLLVTTIQFIIINNRFNSIHLLNSPTNEFQTEVTMFTLAGFIICCGDEAVPNNVTCNEITPIFPCVSETNLDIFEEQKNRIEKQESGTCNVVGFSKDRNAGDGRIVDEYDKTLRLCDNNDILSFTQEFLLTNKNFDIYIRLTGLIFGFLSVVILSIAAKNTIFVIFPIVNQEENEIYIKE